MPQSLCACTWKSLTLRPQRTLFFTATFLIAFVLASGSAPVAAQDLTPTTSISTIAPSPVAEPLPASDEVVALRAQLELMERYDQRLLNTVYWSLASMIGVIALTAFAGWFANIRSYERDRKAMMDELRQEIDRRVSDIRTDLQAEVAQRITEAKVEMKSQVTTLKAELSKQTAAMLDDTKSIRYAILVADTKRAIKERDSFLALYKSTDALQLAMALHTSEYEIPNTVDLVQQALEITPQGKLDLEYAQNLLRVVEKLPPGNGLVADTLRKTVEMKLRPGSETT